MTIYLEAKDSTVCEVIYKKNHSYFSIAWKKQLIYTEYALVIWNSPVFAVNIIG